jgi:hypothetical protein
MYVIPASRIETSDGTRRSINRGVGGTFSCVTDDGRRITVTVCHYGDLSASTLGDVIICCLPFFGKHINPRVEGDWMALTKAEFLSDGSFVYGPFSRRQQ